MAGGVGRRWWIGSALASVPLLASGCAGPPPPPPPPPTVVALTLTAGADANPNGAGQAAPVIIRVYQLASPASFEKAEFFRLLNQDAATLGTDVVKRDEYLLAPGATKSLRLEPAAPVTAIGVFAAYRDFGHVTWRGTVPVPAHKTTEVSVRAGAQGIDVSAKPGS